MFRLPGWGSMLVIASGKAMVTLVFFCAQASRAHGRTSDVVPAPTRKPRRVSFIVLSSL